MSVAYGGQVRLVVFSLTIYHNARYGTYKTQRRHFIARQNNIPAFGCKNFLGMLALYVCLSVCIVRYISMSKARWVIVY